jgi:hypothetical protein
MEVPTVATNSMLESKVQLDSLADRPTTTAQVRGLHADGMVVLSWTRRARDLQRPMPCPGS